MTEPGIIYLVQPAELIGTNRYKIGCSGSPTLNRVNSGYKKGTRYLYVIEIQNPFEVEKCIKDAFKKRSSDFKLIAGTEYFECDEILIKKEFIEIVNQCIFGCSLIAKEPIPKEHKSNRTIITKDDKNYYEIYKELMSNCSITSEMKLTDIIKFQNSILFDNIDKKYIPIAEFLLETYRGTYSYSSILLECKNKYNQGQSSSEGYYGKFKEECNNILQSRRIFIIDCIRKLNEFVVAQQNGSL